MIWTQHDLRLENQPAGSGWRRAVLPGMLKGLIVLAGVLGPASTRAQSVPAVDNLPQLTTMPSDRLTRVVARSIVVDMRNSMVVAGSQIHARLLGDMIAKAVRLATETDSTRQAWRSLFATDEVIGVKFDPVGADALGTNVILARQLVLSLERAGFNRSQIVLIGVPGALVEELGTQPQKFGWREASTAFGAGKERMAAVLDQIDALINVPTLKTDNISGIAGCLRNASLPFVRRQARYFSNGATPAICDLLSLPMLRDRLRIHLINGLRGVYNEGPAVHPKWVWPFAGIIVSKDPVAADRVALDAINAERVARKLAPIGDAMGLVRHVHEAHARGLGTADQDYIQLMQPR